MKLRAAIFLFAALALVATFSLTTTADEAQSWTGEIIDIACYVPKGAQGEGHAACARSCVKNGQPMGLLTDDGTIVLLAADHKNGDAFEGVKDLAGQAAEVTGSLAEKGGIKILTVSGFKAAG
jgi:hypothetical protein